MGIQTHACVLLEWGMETRCCREELVDQFIIPVLSVMCVDQLIAVLSANQASQPVPPVESRE